jgi:hypothetical protein
MTGVRRSAAVIAWDRRWMMVRVAMQYVAATKDLP